MTTGSGTRAGRDDERGARLAIVAAKKKACCNERLERVPQGGDDGVCCIYDVPCLLAKGADDETLSYPSPKGDVSARRSDEWNPTNPTTAPLRLLRCAEPGRLVSHVCQSRAATASRALPPAKTVDTATRAWSVMFVSRVY